MMQGQKWMTGLALAAVLPLAVTTAGAQSAVAPAATPVTRLDISAEGSVNRVPDLVTISAGVVTDAPSAQAALASNSERMANVIAALKKAGIADKDIRTSAISLNPQYRYIENRAPLIIGYQASNQLTVVFRNVAKAGPVLDALVANGANQINGPSFGLEDTESAMDEARLKAMKKARARADLYAHAAGMKVKRIMSISESGGPGPVYPMPMVAMSARTDKAETSIQAGEQAMSITVSVAFELE